LRNETVLSLDDNCVTDNIDVSANAICGDDIEISLNVKTEVWVELSFFRFWFWLLWRDGRLLMNSRFLRSWSRTLGHWFDIVLIVVISRLLLIVFFLSLFFIFVFRLGFIVLVRISPLMLRLKFLWIIRDKEEVEVTLLVVSQLVGLSFDPRLGLEMIVVQELVAQDGWSASRILQDELSSSETTILERMWSWCVLVSIEQLENDVSSLPSTLLLDTDQDRFVIIKHVDKGL
jgi:hypothetical protein